ncbi:DUF2155 domain-containing protein [Pleomorphomonas sp. JP5]|uniref:DUF2155 domain-containing protein n=1 Tax=Pleomorphomonas sp. JP5 TaxID=2942998 RepID=UPI002044B6AF|nr:DUF2155 domain-containing protein [Pleomorphomonas sp. JP5]MCM5558326.1 DUF2155 domain-containing protein [Pleomorphomonas sp. JP5]
MTIKFLLPLAALGLTTALAGPAAAEKIANKVAVFTGLDKITGRTIDFDVYVDETVRFGTLRVTPKVCYSRPATEAAETDGFVEVDEITLDNEIKRIFSGWMFAASPGLNAVEHPVYDVWLIGCRMDSDIPPPVANSTEVRVAVSNQTAGGAGSVDDGAPVVLNFVGGIPLPPDKPSMPSMMMEDTPAEPPAEEGTNGQILD